MGLRRRDQDRVKAGAFRETLRVAAFARPRAAEDQKAADRTLWVRHDFPDCVAKRVMLSIAGYNPTHYAIALRYLREGGPPLVLFKGTVVIAIRVQEIAEQHLIPNR